MAIFTATEAFEMAMEIEKNGEVFYNAVAKQVSRAEVKSLFEELAKQEQKHYAIFQKMAGHTTATPNFPASEYDDYKLYLQATLDNALFSGPDKALAAAQRAQNQTEALRVAIGFEKDTLLFFYDLRDMVAEADREKLASIIREEKTHLRRLAKML